MDRDLTIIEVMCLLFLGVSSPHRDTFPDRSCVVTIAVTSVTIAVGGVEAGGVTLLGHLSIGQSEDE